MAPEGLFNPISFNFPDGVNSTQLIHSVVKISPETRLHLNVFETLEEKKAWTRNVVEADGTETWYRGYLKEDLEKCNDPVFSQQMVNFEFCRLVKEGVHFPAETGLNGVGTGALISKDGYILTNYHLATASIEYAKRIKNRSILDPVLCPKLTVEIVDRIEPSGKIHYRKVDQVWLVDQVDETEAFVKRPSGDWGLGLDIALLKIDIETPHFLKISSLEPLPGSKVWMLGFPMRTSRPEKSLDSLEYTDSDGSLRVSSGAILEKNTLYSFVTDVDGSAGSSGSPTVDANGNLLGLFSTVLGDGRSNIIDYSGVHRQHVTAKSAADYFDLERIL